MMQCLAWGGIGDIHATRTDFHARGDKREMIEDGDNLLNWSKEKSENDFEEQY